MSAKVFVDSNIFLYAFTDKDTEKQKIAANIINKDVIISTQVVNEVSNNMIKKLKCNNDEISVFVNNCYDRYSINNFSQEAFILSSKVREEYALSYYDSLIVAVALISQATILYSEDMQHNLIINKQLTIINPFV